MDKVMAPAQKPAKPYWETMFDGFNLAELDAPEDEKIAAFMAQEKANFNPAEKRPRLKFQNKNKNRNENGARVKRIKPNSGIPKSFMTPTSENALGVRQLPDGTFGVVTMHAHAYVKGKKEKAPFLPQPVNVYPEDPMDKQPEELKCPKCKELLTDAVLIPCCGSSFCDECIRTYLLDEDEDQVCPCCKASGQTPASLIPNKFIRLAVTNFLNKTGYRHAIPRFRARMQARLEREEKEQALTNDVPMVDYRDPQQTSTKDKPMVDPPTPTKDESMVESPGSNMIPTKDKSMVDPPTPTKGEPMVDPPTPTKDESMVDPPTPTKDEPMVDPPAPKTPAKDESMVESPGSNMIPTKDKPMVDPPTPTKGEPMVDPPTPTKDEPIADVPAPIQTSTPVKDEPMHEYLPELVAPGVNSPDDAVTPPIKSMDVKEEEDKEYVTQVHDFLNRLAEKPEPPAKPLERSWSRSTASPSRGRPSKAPRHSRPSPYTNDRNDMHTPQDYPSQSYRSRYESRHDPRVPRAHSRQQSAYRDNSYNNAADPMMHHRQHQDPSFVEWQRQYNDWYERVGRYKNAPRASEVAAGAAPGGWAAPRGPVHVEGRRRGGGMRADYAAQQPRYHDRRDRRQ